MSFLYANVVDILRCSQRDNNIIESLQNYLTETLKNFNNKYHHPQKIINVAKLLYYLLTSVSDLQTLGEEYTGTIRLNIRSKKTPSKTIHLLWLATFIGGDVLFDNVLNSLKNNISESETLTEDAKNWFIKLIIFLENNKQLLMRLHTALFYINGDYYYFTNRLFGIRYVLLRKWFQNDEYSKYFKILGIILFLYLLFHMKQQYHKTEYKNELIQSDVKSKNIVMDKSKICLICSEIRKNSTATFCGHLFCWDCIQDCLKYQQFCPICRESINSCRIILLQNY